MAAEFDAYVRRSTWVHALDPRVKLAFVALVFLFTFLWDAPWPSLAISAACLWLAGSARLGWARVGHFLRGMAPLLLFILAANVLLGPRGGALWLEWRWVQVTEAAVRQGVTLVGRLLSLALTFFVWLSTTDQRELVSGFTALRLPYAWGLTLTLALRYLPILAGLFQQVTEAQQARGLDLAQGGFMARLRAYRPVLVAVVIGALRHGEQLGWALESRALGAPGIRRTTYRPLNLRPADRIGLALLAGALITGLALRIL
ncbi:MAG: energy-coupling factor transporter transmembrane component T family protein [Anaerolineae bacterium]